MKLTHNKIIRQKGLTLVEVLVASLIMGGLAFYVSEIRNNQEDFSNKVYESDSLEGYSTQFLRILDNTDSADPRDNICYKLFYGMTPFLTSSEARHSVQPSPKSIRITPNHLRSLTNNIQLFSSDNYSHYQLKYLELTSGDPANPNLKQIDDAVGSSYEHLYKGHISFIFRDTKKNVDVKTKGETILFTYGHELISCSGPMSLNLSYIGRCDVWGPHARIVNGECKIPYYTGNGASGTTVNWEAPSQINYNSRSVKETLCLLQKRSGVTEGMLCD